MDYHCGQVPQTSMASIAKMYTLMDNNANRRIESAIFSFANDIGFVRENGTLEAVAAGDRIPLAEGNYSWVIEQPRFKGIHPSHYHPPSAMGRGAVGALAGAAACVAVIGAVNAVNGAQ